MGFWFFMLLCAVLIPVVMISFGKLWKNHPQIQIIDFDFYNTEVFNQCENNNCVLMAVENWRYVHPLLKILRVDWDYTIPFGLLHAPKPSAVVKQFLKAVQRAMQEQNEK